MSLKTGATIIKRILFLLVLLALLLPSGITAQSNQTSSKPVSTPVPAPDNTELINQLKDQLRNAENAYQNAYNFLQSLSTNPYITYTTIFQAQNNALFWLNKVNEYKIKLIDLGCYDTSVPPGNLNNNYGNNSGSFSNNTYQKSHRTPAEIQYDLNKWQEILNDNIRHHQDAEKSGNYIVASSYNKLIINAKQKIRELEMELIEVQK